MNKNGLTHIVAAAAFALFIALGLACASSGATMHISSSATFPKDFVGTWKRDTLDDTLTLTVNTFQFSSQPTRSLMGASGNLYALTDDFADDGLITIAIRLVNGNLVISGDNNNGQDNWNGTWKKQSGSAAISVAQDSGPDELDFAIRDASDYLNDNIPKGNMIVILNVQSDSAALSDYVIDELIGNAVNDKVFKVVDRQQLDLIRAEQNFQFSGEVDDKLALSIGKFFGAQTIVSGRIMQLDNRYRLSVRALDVQTAQVQGQYNRNIAAGKTIAALMRSGGVSGGGTQAATVSATGSGSGGTAARTEPPPAGALAVNNVASWNAAITRIRNGGDNQTYVIHVTGTVSVPPLPDNENLFGTVTGLTVTIQGGGTLTISNTNGSLLRIGAGQTAVARNITLSGHSNNYRAVVLIGNGGAFRMENGATVRGNSNRGVEVWSGTFAMSGGSLSNNKGGVIVNTGVFTMSGGTISGNNGDGVSVGYTGRGSFTMNGGTISGNTDGGVHVDSGNFTMSGGTISGNTAPNGGGVRVGYGTSFTMSGGTISGNTGGGVYISSGNFTKTGGTIYGNDSSQGLSNTAISGKGHALYSETNGWRNATAGPDDKTDGYGFWMND
jgi:TolB-like protein